MRLREEWPLVLGVIALIVTYVWFHLVQDYTWHPFGPPVLAAVVVTILAEIVRRQISDDGEAKSDDGETKSEEGGEERRRGNELKNEE